MSLNQLKSEYAKPLDNYDEVRTTNLIDELINQKN